MGNPRFVGILDSWVIPYSIIVLFTQNMMKEMSFYNTVGSSESFVMLCMLEYKLYVSAINNPMDLWVTRKFVEN